jgi:CHAD domain-containing protein
VKARKVKKLDPRGSLHDNAARIIGTRLEELRSLAEAALEPTASVAQHDMRIAAKRLRYVLEVTERCFGRDAKAARRAAKELQGVLGEIHDCDVMLPRALAEIDRLAADDARAVLLRAEGAEDLDTKLVREAPNRAAYRGLQLLTVHLRARRALLFERFRDLWRTSQGTFAGLERVLDGHLRASL